jgi:hypothetical protein
MDYTNLSVEEARTMCSHFIGWANGWATTPPELADAKKKGYSFYSEYTSRGETTIYCPEGNFYYKYDSSD